MIIQLISRIKNRNRLKFIHAENTYRFDTMIGIRAVKKLKFNR